MDLQVQKKWFHILLLTMACTSILAFDSSRSRTFCDRINKRRQSSSHRNQEYEKLCLSRRLLNQHNELVTTEPSSKTLKILIDDPLLIKKVFNATNAIVSQNTKIVKEDTSLEDGLLLSSATNGKDRKSSSRSSDSTNSEDDDKKTLSQQVKEGKYGLIQNEIYPVKPKRPGIISYLPNSEVPRDTIKNFGGLDEEEIWLAENHVLVLKGGNFPELNVAAEQSKAEWPPIDSYMAPRRQVKIPSSPRVPPPFPVQLIDDGPVQLIGSNGTSLSNNGTIDFDVLPGFKGFLPGEGPYFPLTSNKNNSNDVISGVFGSPKKKTKAEDVTVPFYPALPPGAVIVSPPSNQTDYDDEDQSIYYPPPYSFIYSQDNSTDIPPGPLVPGIILPPPPDFFSSIDEKKSTTKDKYVNNHNTTIIPTLKVSYHSLRKSSSKFYKAPLPTVPTVGAKNISYHTKPFIRSKFKNSTFQQIQTEKIGIQDYRTIPLIELTTPTPVKSTTLESPEKYNIQQILGNQVIQSSTNKTPWKTVINKVLPLERFFATTTPISVEHTVETTPASIKTILITENPTRFSSQASYYFYEENNNKATHSSTSSPLVFFDTTSEAPPYYKLEQLKQQQHQQKNKKEYYNVETIPTQHTTKDYNVKFIDSISKNPQVYSYLNSDLNSREKFEIPSIKEQTLGMLHSKPIYYQPLPTRSAPKLSYFTTQKPKMYYRKPHIIENLEYKSSTSKSKPIYQYSFEATNYEKSTEQTLTQKSLIPKQQQNHQIHRQQIQEYRRQKELPLYAEYQNIQSVNDQYDYGDSEVTVEQPIQLQKATYVRSKINEQQPYYHKSTTDMPMRITTLASHQQYFTKQDEQLLDDVTKEYFTVFGKKLSNNKLSSTTPIYGKSSVTDRPILNNVKDYESRQYNGRETNTFKASNIKVRYGDQTPGPFLLKDDVYINYKHSKQLPTLDPNNDFISLLNIHPRSNAATTKFRPQSVLKLGNQVRDYTLSTVHNVEQGFDQTQNYESDRLEQQLQTPQENLANSFTIINNSRGGTREAEYSPRPLSLESDISVNYKNPRPSINLDAELIDRNIPSHIDINNNKDNSYFAYRLPGDSGHFYFLTPQAIKREDSTGGYLYSKPRSSRLLEKRRR
jgi:hypothetical protein